MPSRNKRFYCLLYPLDIFLHPLDLFLRPFDLFLHPPDLFLHPLDHSLHPLDLSLHSLDLFFHPLDLFFHPCNFPVIVNLSLKKALNKPKSITSRNYSLNNIENFKRALGAESWENLYVCADTQESYNIFSSKFHELFNLFFPLNTVKFNKNFHYKEKWFSQGLAVSRREKIRLDNIAAKCPTPTNIKKF